MLCFILITSFAVLTSAQSCNEERFDVLPLWVENGGFLIIGCAVVFCYWGLSVIGEQYLIPSLNVLCEVINLPDSIAGSTVMAVGMQSSQFFQTLASLFVTKSSLGVGSALGSGFFNPLCICAGAALCSKEGAVKLEWRIIVRECIFYVCSLLILLWSLKGSLLQAVYQFIGRKQQLGDCLIVHVEECLSITSIYIVYIGVCSYFESIVNYLCPVQYKYGLEFDDHLDPLIPWSAASDSISSESNILFNKQLHNVDAECGDIDFVLNGNSSPTKKRENLSNFVVLLPDSAPRGLTDNVVERVEPDSDVYMHEYVDDANSFQCYLYKCSKFYSKIRFSSLKWQLRWFTLDNNGFHYCRNRHHPGVGVKFIDIFQADEVFVVDDDKLIFKININGIFYEFRACDDDIFTAVVAKLKLKISQFKQYTKTTRKDLSTQAQAAIRAQEAVDKLREPRTILAPPEMLNNTMSQTLFSRISLGFHYFLLPFKYLLYFTIYDVRQYEYQQGISYTLIALGSCMLWVAVLSTIMVICLDLLARLFGISSSVMGLTFSAVVTSLPNVWNSMSASRKGMGTMAISNAFGSSLFGIFVGLALPWLIYIIVSGGTAFDHMKDEGIVFTVGVLILTLVLFLFLMSLNSFVMKTWMSVMFIVYYIVYVIYAVEFTT